MKLKKRMKRLLAAGASIVMAATSVAATIPALTTSAADLELDNYAKLLQYSLYFYDANFCGSGAEKSAFDWRGACHTGDMVEGGYHDAGDNIKCGQTAGFTASTLGWTYYEFKEQFEKTGTTEHYRVVMDYFCDFFKDSTTLSNGEVTSFVYEMGNDGSDHSTWCAPEDMYDRGSSETYSTTNGASDIAAQYAAALAQNYINFGDEEDLTYATALYNFAAKYRTSTSTENTYYRDGTQDDISWAAGWMYLATGEEAYKTESGKYTSHTDNWTSDYFYGNSWLGAAIINAEITGNWSNATSYIDSKVNSTQNSYYLMNSWGSARHNTLMQLCALVCTKHQADSGKDYSAWAKTQMDMLLGDNSANVCFVVGYNDASATSPHHRAASNLTISSDWHEYNEWDGKYSSSGGYTLYGALVGGPYDTNFGYNDSAKDATSNEVAVDYQAGLVGAAAGLYALYDTGSVVAEIAPEVTVYASEVAVANGGTATTTETTTTTTTTTTETETTTTTTTETTTVTEDSTTTTTETDETSETTETTTTVTDEPDTTTTTTVTTNAGEVIGNVFLAGQAGQYLFWNMDAVGQEPANITGNGTYTAKFNITEGDGTGSIECLILESTLNAYSYSPEGTSDPLNDCGIKIDVDSVALDGVAVEYSQSDNAYRIGSDGKCLRVEILNNWTSPTINDIVGSEVTLTKEIAITFTISGLPGGEVTTESTTTTTVATTTTTITETSTTASSDHITTTTTTGKVDGNEFAGDVNVDGVVDLYDVIVLNKYLAGVLTLTDQQITNAAACNNSDNTITPTDSDVSSLMMYVIMLIDTLPDNSMV